jgi:hypothetical protein
VVVLLALWLAMRGPTAPAPAQALDGGGSVGCVLPPAWNDDNNPRQTDDEGMGPFRLGRAQVTPLAGFSLQARVLSREDYSFGNEADYSPTDLVLGWGPMAAPGIEDALSITQGGRWYHYRWGNEGPPLPPKQIVRNSANMHLVPSNADVAATLAHVRPGETVQVEGWLVRIHRDDGWRWQSSLRRDDTGAGACELVYVCALEARD